MKLFLVQHSGGDNICDKDEITKRPKEYTEEWPCLVHSSNSLSSVFCSVCRCNFLVAYGGRDDCHKHVSSTIHKYFVELRDSNKNVTVFFTNSDEGNAVTNAELFLRHFSLNITYP
ncbi:hypothetical protein PR048_005931 [Dryococelus australis]|uniref:Uncharacterized protein n=1 Tax=Dryococelus australis TaxID=614101 RepID=A0ABQ9I9K1_9NEOP|nr:hypothetical protein PR048_005931 [Dryococelus australis]